MSLIKCGHCGNEISDKSDYCIHCGAVFKKVAKRTCKECGKEITSNLCNYCGYDNQKEKDKEMELKIKKDNDKYRIKRIKKISIKLIVGIIVFIIYKIIIGKFFGNDIAIDIIVGLILFGAVFGEGKGNFNNQEYWDDTNITLRGTPSERAIYHQLKELNKSNKNKK